MEKIVTKVSNFSTVKRNKHQAFQIENKNKFQTIVSKAIEKGNEYILKK